MQRPGHSGSREGQNDVQASLLPSRTVHTEESCQLRGTLPRRFLTEPSKGTSNLGWDNENSDLVLAVEDVLVSTDSRRYVVKDLLGQGTFGQVVKCVCGETGQAVAVKVIKNQTAFYHQARVEVGVLQYLNRRADADDRHHIVRMRDFFLFRNHLCLVFELMSVNLYELVKHNRFKGLSLTLLRVFISQILDALTVLRESNIIHCDLKPENVLLKSLDSGDIKVIDFGSACFENKTMYSYIQSRFYRSPEVLMGHPYNVAIDMWSLGCMAAELFLGLPLFPGASEHDLLVRIVEMLGPLPDKVLLKAQHTGKYFRKAEEPLRTAAGASRVVVRYQLRSQREFEALHGVQAPAGKRYFQHTKLADIIGAYPYKSGLSDQEMTKESERREAFLDFLMGILDLDPSTRWSPKQALQHPFITNQPFRGPFQPSPDPHVPIRNPTFHPGSAPAGSAYGLGVSPYSPEAHAQAHAAAMAAISAHFSPRAAQMAAPAQHTSSQEALSPMSTSIPTQGYSMGTPNRRALGPNIAQAMASTPPNSQMSGVDAAAWNQLSPHYGSGPIQVNSLNPGSVMHSGSLAAVLAPWSQGAVPPLTQPVGSLEALRATWRAPHNSHNSGGAAFNMMRSSGRILSSNLGNSLSGGSTAQNAAEAGLPPLPTINSQDGRLQDSLAFNNSASAEAQRGYLRRSSYDCTSTSGQGLSQSYSHLAVPHPGLPSMPSDYATLMGLSSNSSWSRGQPSTTGYPPPSPQHPYNHQGRRDSLDSGHLPFQSGSYGKGGLSSYASQQPGSASRRTSIESQGGWSKNNLAWQQEQHALQLQRLAKMASGEFEPGPEPSDWDPTYSDDQLLSEELNMRSSEGANVGPSSDAVGRSRPNSGLLNHDPNAGGRVPRAGIPIASSARNMISSSQAQDWVPPNPSFDSMLSTQEGKFDRLGDGMDIQQASNGGFGFTDPGCLAPPRDALPDPIILTGNHQGGQMAWQHPALSASLYTLPEVSGITEIRRGR